MPAKLVLNSFFKMFVEREPCPATYWDAISTLKEFIDWQTSRQIAVSARRAVNLTSAELLSEGGSCT